MSRAKLTVLERWVILAAKAYRAGLEAAEACRAAGLEAGDPAKDAAESLCEVADRILARGAK